MRSPKLGNGRSSDWYQYYAGYAGEFVEDALAALELDERVTVLDPWNGSGTTTAVAHEQGFRALGYDANPALVVIARARLLGSEVLESLAPLAQDVLDYAASFDSDESGEPDPLDAWFQPGSSRHARNLERAIRHVLVDHDEPPQPGESEAVQGVSALAAFFYVALFGAVRPTLRAFVSSNPTWVKTARPEERLLLDPADLNEHFKSEVDRLGLRLSERTSGQQGEADSVSLGDSTCLPLEDGAVAAAVTSPPYCTRIDYVAATRPELAVLGIHDDQLRALRGTMVGTPTILQETPSLAEDWGATAEALLESVRCHASRASGTYYRKYFTQYMDSLWRSMRELRRVVRADGGAVIVVQDSYYKDVHVDLPRIVLEMCEGLGWSCVKQADFPITRTKAAIHPGTRSWRSRFDATESALVLR